MDDSCWNLRNCESAPAAGGDSLEFDLAQPIDSAASTLLMLSGAKNGGDRRSGVDSSGLAIPIPMEARLAEYFAEMPVVVSGPGGAGVEKLGNQMRFPPGMTAAAAGKFSVCPLDDTKRRCDECGKEFNKIGMLKLHMNVHALERSSARKYDCKCNLCSHTCRSKALLQKHVAQVHGNITKDPKAESTVKMESGGGAGAALNPRPFECADCSIAFRIYGHLAKHLRSKLHIMRLECLGKLPIGTYAQIEMSNLNWTEIDTADCDRALAALQRIAEGLGLQNDQPPNPIEIPIKFVKTEKEIANHQSSSASSGSDEGIGSGSASGCSSDKEQRSVCGGPEAPVAALMGIRRRDSTDEVSANSDEGYLGSSSSNNGNGGGYVSGDSNGHGFAGRDDPLPVSSTLANIGSPGSSTDSPSPEENQKVGATVNRLMPARTHSVVATNVWVPPLTNEVLDSHKAASQLLEAASPRDVERARSSSRSPCPQRDLSSSGLPASTAGAVKEEPDMQQPAICILCHLECSNSKELNIHLHGDHIVMRDGNDFRCPLSSCDRVYPSRENLRQHLSLHFYNQLEAQVGLAFEANGIDVGSNASGASSNSSLNNSIGFGPNSGRRSSSQWNIGGSPEGSQEKPNVDMQRHRMRAHVVVPAETRTASNSPANSANALGRLPPNVLVAKRKSLDLQTVTGPDVKQPKVSPTGLVPPDQPASASIQSLNLATGSLTPAALSTSVPAAAATAVNFPYAGASSWPIPMLMNADNLFAMNNLAQIHQLYALQMQQTQAALIAQQRSNSMLSQPLANSLISPSVNSSSDQSNQSSPAAAAAPIHQSTIQQCPVCSRRFNLQQELQDHMLSHSALRPFICEYCDAGFTCDSSLKQHLIAHIV